MSKQNEKQMSGDIKAGIPSFKEDFPFTSMLLQTRCTKIATTMPFYYILVCSDSRQVHSQPRRIP
jgi:hypothetical protein